MRRLEHGMGVADIRARREAHAAHQAGAEVGKDVAEHVLGRQHIEFPGLAHQVERHRIHVVRAMRDIGVVARDLGEDAAHEGEGAEDIRLVHQRHGALAPAPRGALAGEAEGEAREFLGHGARDAQRLLRHVLRDGAAVAGEEQALGALAHDDQVDVAGARVGQRYRHARQRPERPHPGIEVQAEAQVELRRDLGAIGGADLGPAHRAEQYRVGLRGLVEGFLAHRRAGVAVAEGAGAQLLEGEADAVALRQRLQHREGRRRHFRADAIARQDGDAQRVGRQGHGGFLGQAFVAPFVPHGHGARQEARPSRPGKDRDAGCAASPKGPGPLPRDPLATLAKLRRLEVGTAQRQLAEARGTLAAREAAAEAHETALRSEQPAEAPATYGAFLARGLETRRALAAATHRAEAAVDAGQEALALARGAEKLIEILRDRRAAAARRDASRRAQARLDEAAQRIRDR